MESPKRVVKDEPRKSLFVLIAASLFFTLIGLVVLIFGSPDREPIIGQAGTLSLVIGALGFVLYVIARRHEAKARKNLRKGEGKHV